MRTRELSTQVSLLLDEHVLLVSLPYVRRMVLMRSLLVGTVVLLALLISACGGLDPEEVRPFSGLRGTITYVGGSAAWPSDTVYDVRVVAFETKPTVPQEILTSILQQTAAFSPSSLPIRVDTTSYEIEVLATPRTFTYVVVAMQNGPNFQTDWIMLDVYSPSGDPTQPGVVIVPSGNTVRVDFRVDFTNLPPQPF